MKKIYELEKEFEYHNDIFCQDIRLQQVKLIIHKHLTATQKRILILYINCRSYRKTAKESGINYRVIGKSVQESIRIIKREYERNHNK